MLAFHWSRKILRILLNFCPNCGIHDNAKAAQPESADAACFPLTSQHSSVQTQWTCRWQLGTSAGSIHFTILQLWCGHSALDVSAINFRKPQTNNRGWMQTIQVMGHSKGWPCYELMQSKNISTPTVQPSSLGLLERLRSMTKLPSKNWLDNPRTSASLILPVSRFGLTRIAWPSRWCH